MAALDQPTRDIMDRLRLDVTQAPAVSPALLAYLRGLGMDMSTAEDIRAQKIGRIASSATEAVSKAERSYGDARKSQTSDLVRRGVLGSGEANTRYAKLSERNQQNLADIYTSKANQTQDVEQAFGSTQDQLRRVAMERMVDAEQQAAIQKATSETQAAGIAAESEAQKRYFAQLEEFYKKGVV